jgi:hypothetical protein
MRHFVFWVAIAATMAGAVGCQANNPPTNSIKASGSIHTDEGNGDLTIVFTPPDKFRIKGTHPLAGTIVDIGGDGETIWIVTGEQTTVMKAHIEVDDHETWEPRGSTYAPPRAVKGR